MRALKIPLTDDQVLHKDIITHIVSSVIFDWTTGICVSQKGTLVVRLCFGEDNI